MKRFILNLLLISLLTSNSTYAVEISEEERQIGLAYIQSLIADIEERQERDREQLLDDLIEIDRNRSKSTSCHILPIGNQVIVNCN